MRDSVPIEDAVRAAAAEEGRRMAAAAEDESHGSGDSAGTGTGEDLARTARVMARHGYEPRASDREICLANCPFHRLATEHTDLVCGMNLALINGVLDELGIRRLTAELAPKPGFCCVRVRVGAADHHADRVP